MIARATLVVALAATSGLASPRAQTVVVGPGTYTPIFPASPEERELPVEKFRLDVTPVTNAAYLAFVREHPAWRRDRIKKLFADDRYLAHWRGADDLGDANPAAPVVGVSWFAARAFCADRGGRLPVEREWELAAKATKTSRTPSDDDTSRETELLAWYTQSTPSVLRSVGGEANAWGVRDMHGLVWEWIEDFSAALIANDSRSPTRDAFCGGAGASSRDAKAYATFMRIAFRSSLEARFTTSSLGFRCAYDMEPR
ncbi:MAG: formylglycine-generating enzyme family protein [Kofleriaceae bacterium]